MTIFARLWDSLSGLFSHFWADNGVAIEAWGKQFLTDEGQIIFADAAVYGVQIWNGTMTITDAFAKLWIDLKAKGISDGQQAIETTYNALRTHTNLAAQSGNVASTDQASTPAVGG